MARKVPNRWGTKHIANSKYFGGANFLSNAYRGNTCLLQSFWYFFLFLNIVPGIFDNDVLYIPHF